MEWISLGYWGMFLAAFLAATFIPLGSEIVFTGLLGLNLNVYTLTVVATLGNVAGGLFTYYLGSLGRWNWLEKWFKISEENIKSKMHYIQNWGAVISFFTWLPIIGDPLAAALGFARSPLLQTVLWMTIGKLFRYSLLAWLFFNLGWDKLF